MDHFERFKQNKQNIERFAVDDKVHRKERIAERTFSPWEIGVGSSERYRSNWDKIFGKEKRDNLSDQSNEHSEKSGDIRNEPPADVSEW